jgi:hypothetical protein
VIAPYSRAMLVSPALLFLLEPMVGKFVLPLLGSAPEVWRTTVLFFQAALLAGYGFAHLTSRLPARRQPLVQLALLAAAAVVLPKLSWSRGRGRRGAAPCRPLRGVGSRAG